MFQNGNAIVSREMAVAAFKFTFMVAEREKEFYKKRVKHHFK